MQRIEDIDKNFKASVPQPDGMTSYDILQPPFKLYGILYGEKGFYRMDEKTAASVSEGVGVLNYHTSGGRLRFNTDARRIMITVDLGELCHMSHMPLSGSSSFDLYVDGVYKSVFRAPNNEDYHKIWSSEIILPEGDSKEILINFPLYNKVRNVCVSLDNRASVREPKPYEDKEPIVFYGSSITHGGCASHPGNAYPNMISRALDRDFINLGFSGCCKAEYEMCEYIGRLPMSLFVYDYDYNAPTPEFLEATHGRFFRQFRRLNPDVPVIMLSHADNLFGDEIMARRRAVVRSTYENALKEGDKNVYFIDGREFYKEYGLDFCTVDCVHPNDLGFFGFHKVLSEFIKENDL
ncbi:MAG: hypothetical protein IJO68_03780 [Clostridia bacterium]|nr:hypothetical protein [Clostridia bacterium]